MKGKKFYVLLIGLLLVGLGSIFLYRQQEEQRVLEFEGYEISAIESRVEALYNAEKTDLAREITEEELEALETIFEELDEKRLSRRSRQQIQDMHLDFLIAREMLETEDEVNEIFVERNVVDKGVSEEDIDELEYDVLTFEDMQDYVDRNIERLAYARQQVVTIDRATEFVEGLFDDEGNVLETVSREDEEEAQKRIEKIQNKEVKEELTTRMETVSLVLTEREEQLALEEDMQPAEERDEEAESEIEQPIESEQPEEVEETEEDVEEPQYTAPPTQRWTPSPPANSGSGSRPGSSPSGGTTDGSNGGTSEDNEETENNWRPPVQEEPEDEEQEEEPSNPTGEPEAGSDEEPMPNPELEIDPEPESDIDSEDTEEE